nr:unnamed protein product [Callosobruchus chinensis]
MLTLSLTNIRHVRAVQYGRASVMCPLARACLEWWWSSFSCLVNNLLTCGTTCCSSLGPTCDPVYG